VSTLAPLAALRSRISFNRTTLMWGAMALAAIAVFAIDLPLLDPHNGYRPYHVKVRAALIPHLIFGMIALFSGPLQFSKALRARNPAFHRNLGRAYVGSVFLAAPLGILITFIGPKDPFYTIGIATHSTVWFVTTLMAFVTARNRQIAEHRKWMVRSYILTFSFIATRAIGPMWGLLGVHTPHQYGIIDTGLNVVYLLVADIALSWREVTTKRVAPERASAA
jgi:uncharacterized membrane protein